jgi:S1-C subfamily serine protease
VVAQFLLGSHLAQGRGVPKDDRQAAEWYRKAADQGHPGAQFFLGLSYAAGEGVARSESMSIEFLNKSALGFLDEGDREWALRSYDEIRSIDPQHLYVARLRQQLFPPTPNDGAQAVKPEVVVAATGTAWPTADGYVITDRHVIAGATKITLVSTDGARVLATAVAVDASNDLALLRVDDPTRLPPGLPIAAQSVQLGERVFTIGYPHPDVMGARPRLTEGIVNALVGFGDDPRFLQISAAILGGNSGGPLLNARGEVVGIVTSKLDAIKMFKMTGDLPENVGYAIKAGYLRPLLDSAPANQKRAATILSSQEASLPDLAKRVEGSVLLIICE